MNTTEQKQNEQIGKLMKEFVNETVEFYNNIEQQPVVRHANSQTLEKLKQQEIPADGNSVENVYRQMLDDVYSNTLLAQHPRSFSCVPSTCTMLSWMGDVMTNAYNPHASCQINAPAADIIEKKLINWMCSLAGYPKESGGLFVSGGSIANLTALTAARDNKLTYEQRKAVIYISDQTHASVSKGLHIIGFCKNQISIIPTDNSFRMDTTALEEAIKKDIALGRKPFAVVASAGTTNTGSVDPLREISSICKKHNMWLHVDGAFGASVLLSKKYKKYLDGIELSDSLSWDAHKWLLQTYGCSVVLVRNRSVLVDSFAAHPEYLKDAETSQEGIEFWDIGPELTRPARSLKLWITLQVMGSKKIGQSIEHGCEMAKLAEDRISALPNWEIVSSAKLGIVNFRFLPKSKTTENDVDKINQEISKEITASGYAQVFTTDLQGKKVLRMCTINPNTTQEDICHTIEMLNNIAKKFE